MDITHIYSTFVRAQCKTKMKAPQHDIRTIAEIAAAIGRQNQTRRSVDCIRLDADGARRVFQTESYIDATSAILICSGTGEMWINGEPYRLKSGSIILISVAHLCLISQCSDDFSCICMMVSEEFMNRMDATDMIYRRIKYGARLYNTPVMQLDEESAVKISSRIDAVEAAVNDTRHLYRDEVILNRLLAFYLDTSDIIDRQELLPADSARDQNIVKSFIELLVANYRQEHKVTFYSSRLNISEHYLSLIMKRITGQSASDFIFGMLYSDARSLLATSKLSIQEITSILNFSDQSAFGKFFKRRSGISPLDYRKLQK